MEQAIHTAATYPPTWGQNPHQTQAVSMPALFSEESTPRKKKYAKEAWPGKKPPQNLLV